MGCDIHLHIEVKIGGEWRHWGCPVIDRNYKMFAKMAGVRNADGEIDPISSPKGLPEDMTFLTALDAEYWKLDRHHESWLGVDEIELLEDWWKDTQELPWAFELKGLATYLFGSSFTGWKRYPKENRHNIEDVRFIFWFDC